MNGWMDGVWCAKEQNGREMTELSISYYFRQYMLM